MPPVNVFIHRKRVEPRLPKAHAPKDVARQDTNSGDVTHISSGDQQAKLIEYRDVLRRHLLKRDINRQLLVVRDRRIQELSAALAQAEKALERCYGAEQRLQAENAEMQDILLLPGVRIAILKVLHPDSKGVNGRDAFQRTTALYDRLRKA